jgi:phosphatidate cytidylyltransferase
VITRILSAAVLVVLVGGTIWWLPPWATLVLALAAAAAGAFELCGLARPFGGLVPAAPAMAMAVACAASVAAPVIWPASADAGLVTLIVMGALLVAGITSLAAMPPAGPSQPVFTVVAVLLLSGVYVGLPLGALVWIRAACGPASLVWLIAVIAISDTAQYYAGTFFGRRKLAPIVSPKKTVEGLVGGLLAGPIAGGVLSSWGLEGAPAWEGAIFAFILVLFGVAGDLFESLLKRSAGVKDSSALIPGHGGVLDRVDAYLFAAPAFYLLARFA